MIHSYDLGMEAEVVEGVLNNPYIRLFKCVVSCSEQGFTTVNLHTEKSSEPIKRKRHRVIQRFLMFNGTNADMNKILENEKYRIIHRYEFITKQGVIIVLDYEY